MSNFITFPWPLEGHQFVVIYGRFSTWGLYSPMQAKLRLPFSVSKADIRMLYFALIFSKKCFKEPRRQWQPWHQFTWNMSVIASTSAYMYKVIVADLRSLTVHDESHKIRIHWAGSWFHNDTDRPSIDPCLYYMIDVGDAVLRFTWRGSRAMSLMRNYITRSTFCQFQIFFQINNFWCSHQQKPYLGVHLRGTLRA